MKGRENVNENGVACMRTRERAKKGMNEKKNLREEVDEEGRCIRKGEEKE